MSDLEKVTGRKGLFKFLKPSYSPQVLRLIFLSIILIASTTFISTSKNELLGYLSPLIPLPEAYTPQQTDRLIEALAQYRDHKLSQSHPHPQNVSLKSLVDSGFLATSDAEALIISDMTFYFHPEDKRGIPKNVFVKGVLKDSIVLALADGSVLNMTPLRAKEYYLNQGLSE